MTFVIGSRGSALALWQSEHVASLLRGVHGPSFDVEVRVFSTRGDRIQDKPLPAIGGKGLFTAELEEAHASSPLPEQPDVARAEAVLRAVRAEAARRWFEGAPGPWGADRPAPPEVSR